MAKLVNRKTFKKDGSYNIVGYQLAFSKSGIATTGFSTEDELTVEYQKGKIIIQK